MYTSIKYLLVYKIKHSKGKILLFRSSVIFQFHVKPANGFHRIYEILKRLLTLNTCVSATPFLYDSFLLFVLRVYRTNY